MSITITGPLATPNVTLGLSSDGDLTANTTYYVRVVAVTDSDGAGVWGNYPYDSRESVPSVEKSITTTATERTIDVSWGAIAGASHYDVYIAKTSGDYRASN